jgi:hypothetical protein
VALLCGAARLVMVDVAAAGCVDNDPRLDCVEMPVGAARLKPVKVPIADGCRVAEDIVVDTAASKLVELSAAEL